LRLPDGPICLEASLWWYAYTSPFSSSLSLFLVSQR
jgi:hypothetical protein